MSKLHYNDEKTVKKYILNLSLFLLLLPFLSSISVSVWVRLCAPRLILRDNPFDPITFGYQEIRRILNLK